MADQESLEDLKIHFWIEKKVACYSFLQTKTEAIIRWKQCLFPSIPHSDLSAFPCLPRLLTSSLSVHFSKLQVCQEKLFPLHFSNQLSTAPHLLIPPSFSASLCDSLLLTFLPDWKLSLAYLIS